MNDQECYQFIARADDVFIATYPRSGTTWMQMILYQLMSKGDMSFEHIYEVIPFLEVSLRNGRILGQLKSPRIFKTHLPYRVLSRYAGRYIYLMRDGKDVLTSYYYFHKRYGHFHGDFSEFFNRFLSGQVQYGSWFKHVKEWSLKSAEPNVLLIHYEDLVQSLEACIKRIADFCEISDLDQKYDVLAKRCSFEFMKKYEKKFAPEYAPELKPPNDAKPVYNIHIPFLRAGKVGAWRDIFTRDQEIAFNQVLEKM